MFPEKDMPVVEGVKEDQADIPPPGLGSQKKEQNNMTDDLRRGIIIGGYWLRPPGPNAQVVDHFGQSGTIADLYRHFGIDTAGILRAADAMTRGRIIRAV